MHIDNEVPELQVSVNSILFTRVLVNLIHNAALAVEKERELAIWIHVRARRWMTCRLSLFLFQITLRYDRAAASHHVGAGNFRLWLQRSGTCFVKQTVEAMDGSVISESQPGKGTRFIIFLPEVVNHGTKDYDTFH